MSINLRYLKIPIAARYERGEITAWRHKSVSDILDDQLIDELASLRQWVIEQIMNHLDWKTVLDEVTPEMVYKAISILEGLGIKPTGCIYEEDAHEADELP